MKHTVVVFLGFYFQVFTHGNAMPIYGCKVLDLTHDLDDKTPFYPVYKPFNLTRSFAGPFDKTPYLEFNFLCTYEHMGTHMDAPSHFSLGGAKVDQVPFENLVGEACVIDISAKVDENRNYMLSIDDILEWEREHGTVSSDCFILLYTGQAKYWPDAKSYFGATNVSDAATYNFSTFSGDSAEWLVTERKIRAVGVDAISLDGPHGGGDGHFKAHIEILDHAKIPGFENMANLDKLPARGATVMAAPMKIKGGSGAPTRAFAVGWNGPSDPCNRKNMANSAETKITSRLMMIIGTIVAILSLTYSESICSI